MNTWKDQIIEYISELDNAMSPEDAEKLIMTEWSRIKEKFIKHQETKKNDTVDNMQQLDKAMGMAELITLYRDLFFGRQDVFAVRWDNEKTGAHGYAPKCKNEWDRNICGKSMKIKGACKKCACRENQEITDAMIQQEYTTNELYDYLYSNPIRNMQIVMDVRNCLDEKRYPIILTERKEHIDLLEKELSSYVKVYKLHGGLKKKERESIMEDLQNLSEEESRVIIATSKYVGEGFDYPILDTLFLTLPISWSGRVKQYAGRLHRDYHEKKEVRIYDYLDSEIDTAMKMYGKRSKGYRSMGYEIIEPEE